MHFSIITGASSGLGQEAVRQLVLEAQTGDEFWLVARREEKLQELANALANSGVIFRIWPLDLSDPAACQTLTDAAQTACKGGLHLQWVVLAAGLGRTGRLGEQSRQTIDAMLKVNINALTSLSASLLPLNPAYVLLFSSVAAFVPQPYFAVYAASKSYVLSLTRALRVEYPKSHLCAVCPNPVETAFFDDIGSNPEGIKRIGIEKKETVIRHAIRNCKKNKAFSVSCWSSRLILLCSKMLPHRFILFCEEKMGVFKAQD